uniref:F-box domain-containing protein n=1 Tax=Panagrolaimus sp. JU765 TaxID=591449 RepID=A0AC34R5Z7_9BILA
MDSFNFLNLPSDVHKDVFTLSRTSDYLSEKVQRVHPKRIINIAVVDSSSTNVSFLLDEKEFVFDYSNESATDLGRLLSFIQFRTLRIDTELFEPRNVEFFKKFENSWISSVKNVEKLRILSIKDYEEDFLEFLSLMNNLEELKIYSFIEQNELCHQILAKMKNVKNLTMTGPMDDDFLKLLASKTSQEKPLDTCTIRTVFSFFTSDAQEKFKQDVYCVENDEIQFYNELYGTTLIVSSPYYH